MRKSESQLACEHCHITLILEKFSFFANRARRLNTAKSFFYANLKIGIFYKVLCPFYPNKSIK